MWSFCDTSVVRRTSRLTFTLCTCATRTVNGNFELYDSTLESEACIGQTDGKNAHSYFSSQCYLFFIHILVNFRIRERSNSCIYRRSQEFCCGDALIGVAAHKLRKISRYSSRGWCSLHTLHTPINSCNAENSSVREFCDSVTCNSLPFPCNTNFPLPFPNNAMSIPIPVGKCKSRISHSRRRRLLPVGT